MIQVNAQIRIRHLQKSTKKMFPMVTQRLHKFIWAAIIGFAFPARLTLCLNRLKSCRAAEWVASPTAGVIDSQSVKTTEAGGPRGFDAGKKVKGRKRHILTDTTGLLVGAIRARGEHSGS